MICSTQIYHEIHFKKMTTQIYEYINNYIPSESNDDNGIYIYR